jgi:Rrf2 family protein
MQRSAKTHYASLAILELAIRFASAEPVPIRAIAESQEIPSQFLVQILLRLKHAGLVRSSRGAGGGYQLALPPDEITLAAVVRAVEGDRALQPQVPRPENPVAAVLCDAWRAIACRERQMLESTTFATLAARARQPAPAMYYI